MNRGNAISSRVMIIRWRTWALTITTVILLVFYVFVTLVLENTLNVVDFILTAVMQISTHFAYFPDGERYGQEDALYIRARDEYNIHANAITAANAVSELRDFCDFDFEERKTRYITAVCGEIGLTLDEFHILKQKSREELAKIEKFESGENIVYFTPHRRRVLIRLVFGKIPVRPNSPDIILSAVDRSFISPIKDESVNYKRVTHGIKLFRVIPVGLALAYIGYSMRSGINAAAIMKSCVFFGSMVFCAVSSFISGEKSSRVFKKQFYVELSTFIDKFSSWLVNNTEKRLEYIYPDEKV